MTKTFQKLVQAHLYLFLDFGGISLSLISKSEALMVAHLTDLDAAIFMATSLQKCNNSLVQQ